MLMKESRFIYCNTFSCLIPSRNGSIPYLILPSWGKKNDFSVNSSKENRGLFPLKVSGSRILIQSAIGVFALGFIDAGYSGDWSRIGVVSRGTEDLLKAAAFFVVPLCIFLIFSLSKKDLEG